MARKSWTLGCLLTLAFAASSTAQDSTRRVVVEEIPPLAPIYKVAATQTHSGYPVPRFVSLKFNRVNGRQGPSLRHPVLWQYQRKGLPLVVVAEMDIWRKVRDPNGDESWLRTQALSGTQMGLAREDLEIHAKPSDDARVSAILSKDALVKIVDCSDNGWCRVRSDDGVKGWVTREGLWGAQDLQ